MIEESKSTNEENKSSEQIANNELDESNIKSIEENTPEIKENNGNAELFQSISDSNENETDIKNLNTKSNSFETIYPILSNIFIPSDLRVYENYQCPLDNTIVFTNWENVLINAICQDYRKISMIKDFILGSWFLDSSGQFMQINYLNVDIFLCSDILEETNIFSIDKEKNAISLKYNALSINQSDFSFVFRKSKDLPFKVLVLKAAINLLSENASFSLEDLFLVLNQRTYRTPVNTYENIIKEDLFRIQYVIEQSSYFTKLENGNFAKSEVPFGSFIKNELTSNKAINAMIKSFPIGHCFYKSELKKILENEGITLSDEEIILNERVFYFSGRFGIRHNMKFKNQPRIVNSGIDILNNIVVQALSEISQPISMSTLFSVINGKKIFIDVNSNSTKLVDEQLHSNIRSFMNLQPFIFCQNNEYFMIPKSCECDEFGFIYVTLIRGFLRKYGTRLSESQIQFKFNELRFPYKKNEAIFIQAIKSAASELMNFLEIPNLVSILTFDNDYNELFKTSEKDGEINKNSFGSKSQIENKEIKQKINYNLMISTTKSNSELSTDFIRRAKRKKILQDTIPDNQESTNDESNKAEAEDDFENDSLISDLEKKLIRLARKYYNPKILTYSTPKSFVDELIGQKTVNKEGKDFLIKNDTESVELVTIELLNSSRFISNKEHERFCYIGKNENRQNSTSSSNEKEETSIVVDIDKDNNDDDESRDMFSNLNIFDNSDDDVKVGKRKKDFLDNTSDNYYSSNSSDDVSDSYTGIEPEYNKWESPKTRKRDQENKKPLKDVRDEKRDLVIEPNEFEPKMPIKSDQLSIITERLKVMIKSKDYLGPTKFQLFALFHEFGNGMTIEDFENYIIKILGMINGEGN